MNRFWEWMEKNRYTHQKMFCQSKGSEEYGDREDHEIRPTKQMLIGYMDEYMHENGINVSWLQNNQRTTTIEDYYNIHVDVINSIEKNKKRVKGVFQ